MVGGCSWMTCTKWSDVGLQRRGLGSKRPESEGFSDPKELAMDCFGADNTALLHSKPVLQNAPITGTITEAGVRGSRGQGEKSGSMHVACRNRKFRPAMGTSLFGTSSKIEIPNGIFLKLPSLRQSPISRHWDVIH